MYKHFELSSQHQNQRKIDLDLEAFKFKHDLAEHPALSLMNLAGILNRLPIEQVMYSKGLKNLGVNFDTAHIEHKNELSLAETIDRIRDNDSYIMVRSPEVDESFRGLYEQIKKDTSKLAFMAGEGRELIEPKLFLFIASPGAFTPFHIDRYSTLLFQIRGSKEVVTFPQFEEEVVPKEIRECFADYGPKRPEWRDEMDSYGTKHSFSKGEALHIPFIAGHYVKNGLEDVSISMSIIFRTRRTQTLLNAMGFNHRLGGKLKKLGIQTSPVGENLYLDRAKAVFMPPLNGLMRMMHK